MKGLMSAGELPNLWTELARRGYDEASVDKIIGWEHTSSDLSANSLDGSP
jgi:microsomal dipeptidase-like Zn-dependent dipeptidase